MKVRVGSIALALTLALSRKAGEGGYLTSLILTEVYCGSETIVSCRWIFSEEHSRPVLTG